MKVLSTVKLPEYMKEDLSHSYPDVLFYHDKNINEALDILPEADIILTYGEDLTEDHINQAKNLKWMMVASAGIDQLPFSVLEERDILVTNSKGVHAIPMAEYCISMMLQVSRQAEVLAENQRLHKWDRRVRMEELYEKTVLIIGTGAIGNATAKLTQAFGMNVWGVNSDGRTVEQYDKTYKMSEVKEPLSQADFVISVLPSTDRTKGLLNKEFFQSMKDHAVFINIGRGDVVVEKDLIDVLKTNSSMHAVLDVFETEPLPAEHELWDMDNVTITPHLSGITKRYLPRAMEIFKSNLANYISKEHKQMKNKISLGKRY
ncbi:D-2-hydroxyacid dehydrogenase [Metabacillus halosaccharovorans]|uniref:D-2-hydroxyacid dehydrogenase n=1 Tax=Metabacillus halosaccharovorans TaxID=930124 RepID=UPI001C1F69C4|nr:D-2-hydroxyacid dehydrogenase [Metabacillus halosaccharovorans]